MLQGRRLWGKGGEAHPRGGCLRLGWAAEGAGLCSLLRFRGLGALPTPTRTKMTGGDAGAYSGEGRWLVWQQNRWDLWKDREALSGAGLRLS